MPQSLTREQLIDWALNNIRNYALQNGLDFVDIDVFFSLGMRAAAVLDSRGERRAQFLADCGECAPPPAA